MEKLTNAWNSLSAWVVANPYITAAIAVGVVLVVTVIVVKVKSSKKSKKKGRR